MNSTLELLFSSRNQIPLLGSVPPPHDFFFVVVVAGVFKQRDGLTFLSTNFPETRVLFTT